MTMQIAGFMQVFNGAENGMLERALTSLWKVCDQVFIYDDASTEPVRPIYEKYDCIVLYGTVNAFHLELQHKQALLSVVLRHHPDWVVWHDLDALLGQHFEDRARTEHTLQQCEANGIELLHIHNCNLWRSPWWYRTDQEFDGLWHGVFWKVNPEMHYQPIGKLHQKQYPLFHRDPNTPITASKFEPQTGQLLHFGFASNEEIAKKYFIYRASGQRGYPLDRLVDESTLALQPSDVAWFPEWLRPALGQAGSMPPPCFSPARMAEFTSFEEWKAVQNGT